MLSIARLWRSCYRAAMNGGVLWDKSRITTTTFITITGPARRRAVILYLP